jgi:hypothetical protein
LHSTEDEDPSVHDFQRLLLTASMAMCTPLAVAKVLDVQPNLVYRWMAELEQPAGEHLNVWKQRLEVSLRTPKPTASHPRRRAADLRLQLVA